MSQSIRGTVAQRQQAPAFDLVSYARETLWNEIKRVSPPNLGGERVLRLALTVMRKTPDLAECAPESFVGALMTADALGLDPGVDGEAYLVPFGKECTFIVGYQGYVKLFWQHPLAEHIDCRAVYENDEFDYQLGMYPSLTHKPARDHAGKTVIYYYAVARLTTGAAAFEVMTPEQVKDVRGGKVGPKGNIADPMLWMERKTPLRQLMKRIPKSRQAAAAMVVDEKTGSELAARKVPEAITAGAVPELSDTMPVAGVQASIEPAGPPAATPPLVDVDEPPREGPITKAQSTKLHAAFGAAGWTLREDKCRAIGVIVGREITTSDELTRAEAARVITLLDDCIKRPVPADALQDALAEIREGAAK